MLTIQIVLASQRAALANSLRLALRPTPDIRFCARVQAAPDLSDACRHIAQGLILMDAGLVDISGADAVQLVVAGYPSIRVLGFSDSADRAQVRAILRAGATGYILTTDPLDNLAQSLRSAYAGRIVLSANLVETLLGGC